MHHLLFIHKIIFSSTCYEPQVLIFRRIQLCTCSIWHCHSLREFLVACRYTAWVRVKPKYWEKKLSQCHFVQRGSHTDWPGHDPLQWQAGNWPPEPCHNVTQGQIKLFGAPRQWKHFRPLFQAVFLSVKQSNTTPPSPKTEITNILFYILNFASIIKFKM